VPGCDTQNRAVLLRRGGKEHALPPPCPSPAPSSAFSPQSSLKTLKQALGNLSRSQSCSHHSAASPMEQQQLAAWAHCAEAGESSWHKRWISLSQSSLQIYKTDKPGLKPLFSLSLSSLVVKKLASSFERRHSAIVFTLLRNFIISFTSQADLDSAMAFITRVQESVSGCLPARLSVHPSPSWRCIRRGPANARCRQRNRRVGWWSIRSFDSARLCAVFSEAFGEGTR
jgi:hypothetical protein